jgi:hypothetical protein
MEENNSNKSLILWPIKVIIYPIAFILISLYEFLKWLLKVLDKFFDWISKKLEYIRKNYFLF